MPNPIDNIMQTLGAGGGTGSYANQLQAAAKNISISDMAKNSSRSSPMYAALQRMGFSATELNKMSEQEVFNLYQQYFTMLGDYTAKTGGR